MHPGNINAFIRFKLAANLLHIPALEAIIQFRADRTGEFLGHLRNLKSGYPGPAFVCQRRQVLQNIEIQLDDRHDVGPLDLDRDRLACRQPGSMHLAYRGGGERRFIKAL
ncbi:hypothetical protein D3C81_810790 [compost metagenome]